MRIFIILTLLMLFGVNSYAKLPRAFVTVNPKDIKSGDRVEVTIGTIARKNAKMSFPKVEEIDKNRVIKRKSAVSHSIEDINGKKTPLTKRTITHIITPQKDFDVPIFTIKVDGLEYKTVPFRVKVASANSQTEVPEVKTNNVEDGKSRENNPEESNANSDFIFKLSSNKKEVVVGESFIVKVELFEPIDLSSSDLEYTPPKFSDFKSQPLGDGKTLEKGDSVIRTIEYLVSAKKAGTLTIGAAKAKIGIQMTPQAQSPFGFFGTDMQWKQLSTKSLSINVKKAPSKVDIIGKYRIKTILDTKYAKANQPFSYTIEIEGIGNLDNIKEPNIKINNITSYSKEPKIEHILNKDKIYSKYSKKFVFISDKDFTIPSIEYKVYSPSIKKLYTLKTKPYLVQVKKSKSISDALSGKQVPTKVTEEIVSKKDDSSINIEQNSQELVKSSKDLEKVEDLLFDKHYYKRKYAKSGYPLSAIIGALLLGIILGAGAIILIPSLLKIGKSKKKSNKLYGSYEEALNILYPHTTKSKNIENMVEQLYEVVNGNSDIKIDDFALTKLIKKINEK